MPAKWNAKDERQYEQIKRSARKDDVPLERAKEIAARTVNARRRKEGRTPNRRTQGTGNPNAPYEDRTRDELYNLAKERDIKGRSAMSKQDLIRALSH